MASGQEMALKAAMNMVFKMFGIDGEQTQRDIVKAVAAVLSFDTRLAIMERNQMRIMRALNIPEDEIHEFDRADESPSTAPALIAGRVK